MALTRRINELEKRLTELVKASHPSLLEIPGMGPLGAAMIVGETAGAARFSSKDAYARLNGTTPIPVWSGNKVRVSLSRGGNRTDNTALHMAAVTQLRLGGEGAPYSEKLLAAGKTRTEALRLLRRRISDRVFVVLRTDEQRARVTPPPIAPPVYDVPQGTSERRLDPSACHRSTRELDRPSR